MKQLTITRKNRQRKLFIIIGIFLALLLVGVWTRQWYQQQLLPVSDDSELRYITIEPGMSSTAIAESLHSEGVIRNVLAFRIHARLEQASHSIQAGFYGLAPNQSATDILTTLTAGEVASIVVRIPGGSELTEIEEILIEAGFEPPDVASALNEDYDLDLLDEKPAGTTLEGYLFPDTYHVEANGSAADIVRLALVNMQQQLDADLVGAWRQRGFSIHEGLTLASIVQKEAPDSETQARVSQVFQTRLEQGMMLQADPTYLYAARQLGVNATPGLDSPYNTYRYEGLPPAPIATIERSVLEAIASPSAGDYLYFVTGKDGVTRFSRTQREHDAYIQQHGVSGT
ncbi:MAG: endolytic transglycosylase MltG [Candidatus Saccharimonadales bacterium]